MNASTASLLERLLGPLPADVQAALDLVREVAQARGVAVYLVGGCVRDALLGLPPGDVDLSVVGDAPSLAADVAARAGLSPPSVHPRFRTATLRIGARTLDLITARREAYTAPGALPTITPSDIAADLARRDFTINAMAVPLTGDRRGTLLDPHGGQADAESGLLRTLHAESFRDDATRLLRAARYAGRLGFRLTATTHAQAVGARTFLPTISPARVRHEFERIFAELHPARALAVLGATRADRALLPGLCYTPALLAAYHRWRARATAPSQTPWLLPVVDAPAEVVAAYADRFALTHHERRAAASLARVRAHAARWSASLHHGVAVAASATLALDGLPLAAIEAWACRHPDAAAAALVERYAHTFRHVRPRLTAADLHAMGVPASRLFGRVLHELRALRLDEPDATIDDERALVARLLAPQREGR